MPGRVGKCQDSDGAEKSIGQASETSPCFAQGGRSIREKRAPWRAYPGRPQPVGHFKSRLLSRHPTTSNRHHWSHVVCQVVIGGRLYRPAHNVECRPVCVSTGAYPSLGRGHSIIMFFCSSMFLGSKIKVWGGGARSCQSTPNTHAS